MTLEFSGEWVKPIYNPEKDGEPNPDMKIEDEFSKFFFGKFRSKRHLGSSE